MAPILCYFHLRGGGQFPLDSIWYFLTLKVFLSMTAGIISMLFDLVTVRFCPRCICLSFIIYLPVDLALGISKCKGVRVFHVHLSLTEWCALRVVFLQLKISNLVLIWASRGNILNNLKKNYRTCLWCVFFFSWFIAAQII